VVVKTRPILIPVTRHIRQIVNLTISLVLLGLLSGCSGINGPVKSIPAKWGGWPQDNFAWLHMPPQILCVAEDSIGVAYHTTRYDEAMQAITEHCVDGWVETKLVTQRYYRTIYAACLQADGSPAVSQPCEYVGDDEQVGFGEEH
jgi:hypothetical protein